MTVHYFLFAILLVFTVVPYNTGTMQALSAFGKIDPSNALIQLLIRPHTNMHSSDVQRTGFLARRLVTIHTHCEQMISPFLVSIRWHLILSHVRLLHTRASGMNTVRLAR